MLEPAVHDRSRFELDVRATGTTRIVAVAGELDLAVSARFQAAAMEVIAETPETAVIDLSALEFVDSSGIHALLGVHRHAAARRVRLVVIPVDGPAQRAFGLSGVETILPFVASPRPGGGDEDSPRRTRRQRARRRLTH